MALALLALGPSGADAREAAAVQLRVRWERSFELPAGMNLYGAQVLSGPGARTFIGQTTGQSQVAGQPSTNAACTVVVVDPGGARALSYRYRGESTGCVALAAAPDGGVYLRGARLMVDGHESGPGEVTGFAAYLDASGREVWALDDQALVDARPVAEQGTGALGAAYEAAQPPLVSAQSPNRLLGFGRVRLRGAGSPPLSRGYVVDADSGALLHSGLGFEMGARGAEVARVVRREGSADFLVQTQTADGLNAEFFVYNGRRGVERLQLEGHGFPSAAWAQRTVRGIGASANGYTYILSEIAGQLADEIVALDARGEVVWRATRGGQAGWQIDGRVLSMVVGPAHLLVYYADDSGPRVQILDADDGAVLGSAGLSEVGELGVVGIWGRPDGSATMLAVKLGEQVVHEFHLDVVDDLGQTEPDAGRSDAGPGADAGHDEDAAGSLLGPATHPPEGCAAGRGGADSPLRPAGLAIGLLVITIATRRYAAGRERLAAPGSTHPR